MLTMSHKLSVMAAGRSAAAATPDAGISRAAAVQPRRQAGRAAGDEPHSGHAADVHVRANAAAGHEVRSMFKPA